MAILYDQFNRPIERPKTKPESRPLAAPPLSSAYREYVANGLTPQKLAALLVDADNGQIGRQAELFEQIEERDGHIIGEIGKRKNVILDVDFAVTPASEDAKDVQIAEAVEQMISDVTDFPEILVACQDAVGKGFCALEIFWDVSSGQAVVDKMEYLEQKRFVFTDAAGNLSKIPRLLTEENIMGEAIAPFKIMFHRYGGKCGHPVRSAIHRICTWWYLFKNYAIKDWLIFTEVFGMPLRLGYYGAGASEDDKTALELAVRLLGSDAAGIISESTKIEFIENKGKASADLYQNLASFGNREISKAILGGTLTAEVGQTGSYAAANTHNEVRLDLLRADARAISATIRDQVIRPFVGFNFGWDSSIPKYEGVFAEPEDLNAKAEIIDKLADRMDIPVSHVRSVFAIPGPEKGEEVLRPRQAAPAMPEKAALSVAKTDPPDTGEPDAFDLMLSRLEEESDPYMENLLTPIRKLLSEAESLEDFRDAIIDAYPDMDAGPLGELIARAMTAAELMGMYEVKTGG